MATGDYTEQMLLGDSENSLQENNKLRQHELETF